MILVVIFDAKSSLGLVRLRVKRASEELNRIFEALLKKVQEPGGESRSRRLRMRISTTCSMIEGARDELHQLHGARNRCKIVYYGPGLCGKTTNLQYIYERTNPDAKGKMISLATETERTLFFISYPCHLVRFGGSRRGFTCTRFLGKCSMTPVGS